MAGTISFGGVGSGMDTEGIVTGLVNASSGTLNTLKSRASATDSAVSQLSNVGSLLATLKKAVDGLANVRDVGSYKASSSNAAIAVSANGTALPGAYRVEISQLAQEQRNYSSTYASSTTALGQSGSLEISVGAAQASQVTINTTDTLEDVAGKINASGSRVSASIFYDGSQYRMQVRGLDTGAANVITFGETGVNFGLNAPGSRFQEALNASVEIDDIPVTSATNQITGAIQGVTLALTEKITTPVTVKVDQDPQGLETKLKAVVDAYNAVVTKIHDTAGFGKIKASNAELSGDSALRSITSRMSNAVLKTVSGSGSFDTLSEIGLNLGRDGKLNLDSTKLSKAMSADSASVASVLAGAGSGSGVMDVMSGLVDSFTDPNNGVLATRKTSFESRAKSLRDQATREQTRLDRYADLLRKQFTNMDATVAGNNAQLSYLQNFYSGR